MLVFIAGGLAYRFWPRASEDRTSQEAAQIARNCAGGRRIDNSAKIEAGLGRYLTRASAETKVSSSDVGTVTSKLRPDGVGLEFYKVYTQCLKDGTENYLKLKGIAIVPDRERREERPPGQAIERLPADNPPRPMPEARKVVRKPVAEPITEVVRCNSVTSINQSGGITACENVATEEKP